MKSSEQLTDGHRIGRPPKEPPVNPELKPELSDRREQLVNQGEQGTIQQCSLPISQVTRINGFLLDIDLHLFRPSSLIPDPDLSPAEFYEEVLRLWLDRHPVLKKAEVRNSGSGLHVILRPCPSLELKSENEREQWELRAKILQAALPIDPNQPGLSALTRPIGSFNSKTGAEVTRLRAGEGIGEAELKGLAAEIAAQPFKFLLNVLAGADKTQCPVCQKANLLARACFGNCYQCGKVELNDLLGVIFQAEKTKAEVSHAA